MGTFKTKCLNVCNFDERFLYALCFEDDDRLF